MSNANLRRFVATSTPNFEKNFALTSIFNLLNENGYKISISYVSRIIFQKCVNSMKFLKILLCLSKYRSYAKIPRALVIYAMAVSKTYVGA